MKTVEEVVAAVCFTTVAIVVVIAFAAFIGSWSSRAQQMDQEYRMACLARGWAFTGYPSSGMPQCQIQTKGQG